MLKDGHLERDLFTSAANELEDIFKPPAPALSTARTSFAQSGPGDGDHAPQNDTTYSSSPPELAQEFSNYETYGDPSSEEDVPQQIRPSRTNGIPVKYRLNEDEDAGISENSDLSAPPYSPLEPVAVAGSSQLSPFSRPLGAVNTGVRVFSNQSAAQHEDFSPILIARHSSEDGKIDFAPVGLSASDLQQRLEKLQTEQVMFSDSEDGGSRVSSKSYDQEAAEAVKQLGSFVNVRRGGRSADDSFRQRVLSTGLGDTSDMLPEESLQASTPKQFPSIRLHEPSDTNSRPRTPSFPAAPFPSPQKKATPAPIKSASPLKLFGQYDTFTNQTLLNRISQFEDPNSSPLSERLSDEHKESFESSRHIAKPASRNPSDSEEAVQQNPDPRQKTRVVSRFGAGELDGFSFGQDFTRLTNESEDDSILHHSVSFQAFKYATPPAANNLVIGKRRQKTESTVSTRGRTLSQEFAERGVPFLATPTKQDLGADYKKHLTSPTKNPTPKRRRTLHQSDIAFGVENDMLLEPGQDSQQEQLVVGKKRKETRPGDLQQTANGNVLASRQMLRTRTPTLSQKSPLRKEIQLDAHRLQEEIAKLPPVQLPKAHHPNNFADEQRRPSIRTQDFLNEAHRIMAAIRGKTGLQSGLASLEESDEDYNRQPDDNSADDASFQDSTRERFSRPPSRDGSPIPRAAKRQEDPKLVNHLKKYEEHSGMDDIIASSLRSLGVSKEDIRAAQALEQNSHSSRSGNSGLGILDDSRIVSDPPNIRIFENRHRYENSTAAEQAERFRDRFPSNGSGSDSGFSTVRTGSSRNSDTRRTIAPESVSHLIPDEVGSMYLDKKRNVWLRKPPALTRRMSENSDDDIFAGIPDLTVDVSKELQNLRHKLAQQGAANARAANLERLTQSHARADQSGTLRSILVKDPGEKQNLNDSPRSPSRLMKRFVEADDEDVEHEITIHDDRLDETSPKRRTQVNFSSPVSIVIQDVPTVASSDDQEGSIVEPVVLSLPRPSGRHGRRKPSSQAVVNGQNASRPRIPSGVPSRRMDVKGEDFVPQPVSVIEEQDEDSQTGKADGSNKLGIVGSQRLPELKPSKPRSRQTSMNILVSTPARREAKPRPENAEVLSHYVGNLSLSPLADFTAHQEQSYALEVSYVLGDENLVTGDGSQKHMSQAVRHLVDKIAEAEAFEPFWEDMRDLELQDKALGSLHMLDRFCGRLVRLNVSGNTIRALDGIPCTVRELSISHNMLSNLTAWDRLANLQCVDISNNQITSLSSFQNLVHLRDLVADNTGLVSLDGIKYHETLQTIRARGNAIKELDFEGTGLQRLSTLDLESNQIWKVENLQELSSLSHLNLKGNQIVEFAPKKFVPLTHLRISNNKLRSLDLTAMTRLYLVFADRNRLTTVSGLHRTPHLDSLSLREQGGSNPFDMRMLSRAYEVRKLFLSGNRIGTFTPPCDFLNLQRLDLANCGLQRLPDNLGQMMPNLRVLNLNFNGLSDLSSLVGIARLKRLYIAGNRFHDLKSILKVLTEFRWLAEVDLRDTALTQGFYPTVHMVVHKEEEEFQHNQDPFKLPDADYARDARFRNLLDMETRIQRRVYERKMVRACEQLQRLDGLQANKRVRYVKDIVWKTMVERGLLLRPDGSFFDLTNITLEDEDPSSFMIDAQGDEESQAKRKGREPDESARWGAEDSFA